MTYIFNEQNLERQRLLAKTLAPHTHKLLDSLSLPADAHTLDLGCGLGETTLLLAQRIGNSGQFTGLDQDADLLAIARQRALAEGTQIDFRQGDATKLPFVDQSFDFVFARFLLVHIPDPAVVLREMIRVCKPGGIVAVQEPDLATEIQIAYPRTPAYEKFAELLAKTAAQPILGRKLGALFQEAGYTPANMTIDARSEYHKTDIRRLDCMNLEALGPTLIAKGLMDDQAIHELAEQMKVEGQAGNTFYMRGHVASAWVAC